MENARLLDERLRRIIGEVSGRTGREIKKTLLEDFEDRVRSALNEHSHREAARFLAQVKRVIEKI